MPGQSGTTDRMSGDSAGKLAWIRDVLGVNLSPSRPAADATPKGKNSRVAALAAWKAARGKAVASLVALERAVARPEGADVAQAVVLLRAVRANLTPEPSTAAQVAELRRYIETDDVIADAEMPNGFGVKVSLRAPLLGALAVLEAGA